MNEERLASIERTKKFLKGLHRISRQKLLMKTLVLLAVPVAVIFGVLMASGHLELAGLAFAVVPLVLVVIEVSGSLLVRREVESLDLEPLRVLPVAYRQPDLFAFKPFVEEPLREHFLKLTEALTSESNASEALEIGNMLIANGFDGTLEEAWPLLDSRADAEAWVASNAAKKTS